MTPVHFKSLLQRSNLETLKEAVKSQAKVNQDEGFWKLTTDKAGNGTAIIRFLPAPPPETVPFVMFYRHAFEGPNGWYIENSRTTTNESDPASDYNSRLWATKDESLRDQVRKQARKLTYISNIYVVQDKANPENEGKVFLYRYGKKIFEKIKKAIEPDYEGDEPLDPFHVLEGANFRLRQKKQAGYPNYDDSMFESSSPLLKGDETAIYAVLNELKSLTDFVAPDKFKSYEELKKKLDKTMGFDTSVYLTPSDAPTEMTASFTRSRTTAMPDNDAASLPSPAQSHRAWTPPVVSVDDDDDAVALSKFDDE